MSHWKNACQLARQEMVGSGHRKEVLQAERTSAKGTKVEGGLVRR